MHLEDYAGFLPGVVVAFVLAALLSGPVRQHLRIERVPAFLLLVALGVILAATVTPSREAVLYGAVGSGTCDLSTFGFAPLSTYVNLNDTSLNVALFVPLGLLVGLLPRSPYRLAVFVTAASLPIAIEGTQLVVTSLGRGCESGDVFNNLTGLLVGAIAAGVLNVARWAIRHS